MMQGKRKYGGFCDHLLACIGVTAVIAIILAFLEIYTLATTW